MNSASARRTSRLIALGGLATLLALSGCATAPGSSAPTSADTGYALASAHAEPPTGEVIATGTVIDVDGAAKICLGAVQESSPPQCVGTALEGWSWEAVTPEDETATTRWGAYGMTGTYDGTAFTVASTPVPLALFDSIAGPVLTCDGTATDDELAEIQETVAELLGPDVQLGSGAENGCLWVDVVWDDGTLQQAADDDFGAGVVRIRSALWHPAVG